MATSKFGKAFAAARKAGKKEFSFGGKSYNTKLREGKTPVPSKKPAQAQGKASTSMGKGTSAASAKSSVRASMPARERADYPKPAKSVGVAKKGSAISKAVAKKENKPVKAARSGGGGY